MVGHDGVDRTRLSNVPSDADMRFGASFYCIRAHPCAWSQRAAIALATRIATAQTGSGVARRLGARVAPAVDAPLAPLEMQFASLHPIVHTPSHGGTSRRRFELLKCHPFCSRVPISVRNRTLGLLSLPSVLRSLTRDDLHLICAQARVQF